MIKTLVIDDEVEAREGISLLLQQDPEIELVGTSKNGLEAIQHIEAYQPELLFLDIQMPKINGFEVVNSLSGAEMPLVVFVTAYDQYALKAFEIHAIDYLLKPFTDERFFDCLTHAKSTLHQGNHKALHQLISTYVASLPPQQESELLSASSKGLSQRLVVKSSGKIYFLTFEDIIWIEAQDYYIDIHLADHCYRVRESMKSMEQRLPESQFVRIHKSSIVNLTYIDRMEPFFNGEYMVFLRTGQKLKLSRGHKEKLWKRLGY